ncbi:MAG: glycosyltransferase family 4 protein [Planctomycetota bacterium]|nr:glycosyltransferase family 4 protein [Planctomycetota bacterium]MDA1112687.1 glycosyltransferase family 4 protein [Planctomycetota bacterium]
MRLLVVYRGLPWPYSEGYHLRILHLFSRLAKRHEVHLLALIQDDEQRAKLAPLEEQKIFSSITLLDVPRRSGVGRFRTNLGIGPVSAFRSEYPGFDQRVAEETEKLVSQHKIDAAYVFDPWADLWFRSGAKVIPTLLDICDCRTLFYDRHLDRGGLSLAEGARTRQLRHRFLAFETFAMKLYPMATAVSPLDQERLERMHPTGRVELIPNGVDLDMFQPVEGVEEVPGNLILFGNMDFLPNVDAAIHFARDILPLVRARHPEVTFTIVGTNPVPEVLALAGLPGVEVTGRVEDLKPFIQRACMLVAPMRFGAGIKNKVLESMAVEKPVVTNSTGVEAMHDEVRELLVIADEDHDFATAVSDLLDDPERRAKLGHHGREVMGRLHSWDAAAEAYERLFEELAASK